MPFKITDDTLQSFQFIISRLIYFTNCKLMQYKLLETYLCIFCGKTKESIIHLFVECQCFGVRCSSMVRWVSGLILHGGPIELLLIPASAPRLV